MLFSPAGSETGEHSGRISWMYSVNQTWTKIRPEPLFLLEPELHSDHYILSFHSIPVQSWTEKSPSKLSFPLQSPTSLVLPAALPDGRLCSERGPLSPSSTTKSHYEYLLGETFVFIWDALHTDTSVHLPNRYRQVHTWGTGRPLLSSRTPPLPPCWCCLALMLFHGASFQLLHPARCDQGSGTCTWKSEVPSRGVADVWEKAALGKRLFSCAGNAGGGSPGKAQGRDSARGRDLTFISHRHTVSTGMSQNSSQSQGKDKSPGVASH